MSQFAGSVMERVRQYANDVLKKRAQEFRTQLIYQLQVLVTEAAWMKTRVGKYDSKSGKIIEEPAEINIDDVMNALRMEESPGDDGVIGWAVYLVSEFLDSLDSKLSNAIHIAYTNAQSMIGGGG